MKRTRNTAVLATAVVMLGGAGFAAAGDPQTKETQAGEEEAVQTERQAGKTAKHGGLSAVIPKDELAWSDGPASLPPGAEAAVLEGDPSKKGPFTLRLRMPAGYEIKPHTHPEIEHVTVISGTLNVVMGDRLDEKLERKRGEALSAGGFMVMQPGMAHAVWTTGETVIQLHGIGPWQIDYLKPSDDPRQRVGGQEEPTR